MLTRPREARSRRWVAGIATLVLATGLAVAVQTTAVAQPGGGECPIGQTNCDGWGDDGGDNGGGGNDGGDSGGNDGGGGGGVYDPILGWLNPSDGCYYKRSEPQPDGVPEGMIRYVRTCLDPYSQNEVELPEPPDGFDPPDPAEIGADLFASLNRRVPEFRVAPSDGPGLVGLPVWLWIEGAGPNRDSNANYNQTWGPLSDSDTVQDLFVEVRAWVTKIEWKMGNGEKVVCQRGDDQPYAPSQAGKEPPCGYPTGYRAPRTYEVTATAFWEAEWRTSTDSGPIEAPDLTFDATIEIDELQVVTE
jgi:hypothetical protein